MVDQTWHNKVESNYWQCLSVCHKVQIKWFASVTTGLAVSLRSCLGCIDDAAQVRRESQGELLYAQIWQVHIESGLNRQMAQCIG